MKSLLRLRALLAHNLELSGSLPSFGTVQGLAGRFQETLETRREALPLFEVISGGCEINSGGNCISTPGFPANYPASSACQVKILAQGYLTASDEFKTEFRRDILLVSKEIPQKWDYMSDYNKNVILQQMVVQALHKQSSTTSGRLFYGLRSPLGEYVSNGSYLFWATDEDHNYRGWNLCYDAARQSTLETLSLTRNYLVGELEALSSAVNLRSLLLSSNLFSCDAPRLDDATDLGEGVFFDPAPAALKALGEEWVTLSPGVYTPLLDYHVEQFTNIALVFAGNPALNSDASLLTGTGASKLLRADKIRGV